MEKAFRRVMRAGLVGGLALLLLEVVVGVQGEAATALGWAPVLVGGLVFVMMGGLKR